jgi:predicted neuraminidase
MTILEIGVLCACLLALPGVGVMAEALPTVVLPAPEAMTNHGPGLIALPSGALMACWYSGTTEANVDSRILCSGSDDGGETWTAPRVAVAAGEQALGAEAANKALGNVTLHHDSAGRLWMIYGVIQRWDWPLLGNVCRNWLCGRVDAKISLDHGTTWSAAVRFDDQTGALPRGRPLAAGPLGDVIPLYREGAEESFVRLVDLARVPIGQSPQGEIIRLPASHLIQPCLVAQADGSLRAFFRDSQGVSIHTAVLDLVTRRWSDPVATNLPNPGAAVDAFRDDQGRFVVIYNPSTDDRRALRLASSVDGVRFRAGCHLVAAGRLGDVAYPSVIRADDGLWHLVFSSDGKTKIRHIAFDKAWLGHCLAAD